MTILSSEKTDQAPRLIAGNPSTSWYFRNLTITTVISVKLYGKMGHSPYQLVYFGKWTHLKDVFSPLISRLLQAVDLSKKSPQWTAIQGVGNKKWWWFQPTMFKLEIQCFYSSLQPTIGGKKTPKSSQPKKMRWFFDKSTPTKSLQKNEMILLKQKKSLQEITSWWFQPIWKI